MVKDIVTGIRATLVFWLITAIIYPFFLIFLGQVLFADQANGSLIKNELGKVIGSALIGQNFTSDKYFWTRPSAINYSEGEKAQPTGISGASNLAPSNPDLLNRVEKRSAELNKVGIKPSADLVYTSGSGLDPHITIESAKAQIERIAAARSLDKNKLEILINQNTDSRFLGIFGEPGVNVVKLNIALDKA
ncbi:K(+)-transporting ATPase subunit C [Gloeothece verrucosa]|uniref:Potassium-transporting ATPase KdpC subunit n=1 Tax=Gloeothece verrucosa (strain PCC 7822) TaxID=497965 RepID=E0UCQ1_GLOV7|nr:K(+)-transporting ATPase subunit C [Gloeothece verrucosa]ADN15245.1 potassium-transporting ATPase, C subunit [Gloeothece verrucosa PCC 7822]